MSEGIFYCALLLVFFWFLSLYASNMISRNVIVSDASKEVQTPLRPNNFASMIAQRIMAMIPRIREPAMAIFGSSTAEK